MATIQIRDIPEDAYDAIRRRARSEHKSLQVYMRDQVIELARRRTKAEVLADLEAALTADPSGGVQVDDVLADLAADRRVTDLVLDASALVVAIAGTSAAAKMLRDRIGAARCHAPHLVDAEVGNVLRRQELAGKISPAVARTGLLSLAHLIDERYPATGQLAESAWRLRGSLTFYDALYVALAAAVDAPLLTVDERLSRSGKLPCRVEVVA